MIRRTVGPYEITEKLGQGGMGAVYKAVHKKINQVVAIKIMHPNYAEDIKMQARFIKEARIQAKFSHPNIVDVLNYFEDKNDKFLVLEYIDGTTLEEKLKELGCLSIEDAISISKQVLNALEFLHSKGVVHRDMKPSNIMFDQNGTVKVTDFGTAKILGDIKNTKTGLVGSYAYMSPEQILGDKVTEESDIYSFGVTLYTMVTGRLPFEYDSEYKVMKGHLEENPIPPWVINKNVPIPLGQLILRTLSKKPKDRFNSVRDLSAALSNLHLNEPWLRKYKLSRKVIAGISTAIIFVLISYLLVNRDFVEKNVAEKTTKDDNPSLTSVPQVEANEEIEENKLIEDDKPLEKKEELKNPRNREKEKDIPPGLKKESKIAPGPDKKWRIRK